VRGVVPDRNGRSVWQVYEDLGGYGLDQCDADHQRVGAMVELIAELHARFAGHVLLDECRLFGDDLGISFFNSHVTRSLHVLKSLDPTLQWQAELRDRLLERVQRLHRERDERAELFRTHGGPYTLLHGDLWTTNTLITENADACRARLIDWDHAGAGPVGYDMSTFLYRFAADDRPWILELYRQALARYGWELPPVRELNRVYETAEYARYACCLAEAASAASRHAWGFDQLAEIERWFVALEPCLALNDDGNETADAASMRDV
jgi:aminoglycoside/choline kinase family phosphotransferase